MKNPLTYDMQFTNKHQYSVLVFLAIVFLIGCAL